MAIFFKNSLFLLLGVLALVTNVLSVRINYAAKITGGGVGDRVTKNGGTIPDEHADLVLNGVHGWSNGEFRAARSRHAPNLITIQQTQEFPNSNAANTAVQNIQHRVSQHVNAAGQQGQQGGGGC